MKLYKKFLISAGLISMCGFVFAQQTQVQKAEKPVEVEEEESVESDYFDNMVAEAISSMADADDLETKLMAMSSLTEAIEGGNRSPALLKTLDDLAGEGITREKKKNGRTTNNWPEIRRDACLLLGQVPTEHSKNTLVNIAKQESEPMVAAAAIKSLGDISKEVGCVEEAVDAICFFNTKNSVLNPTSSFAWEVLIAFEKLNDAVSTEQIKQMNETIAAIATNYNYNPQVRRKAIAMLQKFSKMSNEED